MIPYPGDLAGALKGVGFVLLLLEHLVLRKPEEVLISQHLKMREQRSQENLTVGG